jgi:hypothetical protein
MNSHAILYLVIAIAYGEAAFQSLAKREYHCGCRELLIALLYACIAVALFDPCSTHPCTVAA